MPSLPSLFNFELTLSPSFQSAYYLSSQPPLLLVLLLYSWGKTVLLSVCHSRLPRESWEKNYIIWQVTSTHNHLPKPGSTLPGDLLCFSRFVHLSTYLKTSFQIFVYLLKPPCILSFLLTLFREHRNQLMETTSTSCQQISKRTCSCTRCSYFLPVMICWRCSSSFRGLSFPPPATYCLWGNSLHQFPHLYSTSFLLYWPISLKESPTWHSTFSPAI